MRHVLEQIREGMSVAGRDGEQIGTVDFLHFGDDDASTARQDEPAASPAMEAGQSVSVIDVFTDMLRGEDMPESLRQRLMRQGFLRIEAKGFFGADRYVTPDQIDAVLADRVRLKVGKDELMRRGG